MSNGTKYFHPKIGDIKVGYECDLLNAASEWFTYKLSGLQVISIIDGSYGKLDQIRVFYPSKEAMIAEGWKVAVEQINDSGLFWALYKNNLKIKWWSNIPQYLEIYEINTTTDPEGCEVLRYTGKCPSMNEFRDMIKLVTNG